MSVTLKLNWRDNAKNDLAFKIKRSGSSVMDESDLDIISLAWDGSQWTETIEDTTNISAVTINQFVTPSSTGIFSLTFTDGFVGSNYYGVSAGNATGYSDIISTDTAVTID